MILKIPSQKNYTFIVKLPKHRNFQFVVNFFGYEIFNLQNFVEQIKKVIMLKNLLIWRQKVGITISTTKKVHVSYIFQQGKKQQQNQRNQLVILTQAQLTLGGGGGH
eukprot:TRINITY_DN34558_c0_g1_i1.p2 TRINITY_DN34558_c0_g1~~TRINITY_DN34558_c0_g1_i1.p2  ORF type:complete len:107 (-),score=7.23 TRINITY_DN34558_c0_g1_i1:27-347(-)